MTLTMLRLRDRSRRAEREREKPGKRAADTRQKPFWLSTIRWSKGEGSLTVDIFNERLLRLPQIGETTTLTFPPHACWIPS